jgi:4-hydroxybenzoate polyprenyltransferase
MNVSDYIRLARPHHWVKNVIVLLPVVFAQRMDEPGAWALAAAAAAAFCLASSGVYVLNDLRDRHADRLHPAKRDRPLASGRVRPGGAGAEAAILLAGGLALSAVRPWLLPAAVGAYVALQLGYTYYFKQKMILDVMCIALGFVLRAAGGAVAIGVEISPWLFVCTLTICLFMGFCKRYSEAAVLGDGDHARNHRPTLAGYSPWLLTHLVTLSGAIAIIAFLLYAVSDRTVANLGTNYLIYTLPLVIYGVCRFAMLSMTGRRAGPVELILGDRPFQLTVLLWIAAALLVLLRGEALRDWLAGMR